MSSPPSLPDVGGALVLPASCGTPAAVAMHAQLREFLDSGRAPLIDASAVENIGQATLQLLLAARAEWPELRIAGPSAAFESRVRACALAGALGLDEYQEG